MVSKGGPVTRFTWVTLCIVGFLSCAVILAGAVHAEQEMAATGSHLGDIVSFDDGMLHRQSSEDGLPASARPIRTETCVIDPAYIADKGGSFLVTSVDMSRAKAPLRVHWSGTSDTAKETGCHNDADLWIEEPDLSNLAASAGGYGIGDKKISTFPAAPGPM